MCQHTAGGHWLGPAIGMLLLLLVTEPLAAGQERPFTMQMRPPVRRVMRRLHW